MSYPNAYCVKCGKTTDTHEKHTVMLQNGARALKGVCQSCTSDVYKILPRGKAFLTKVPMTAEEQKKYPDAFCVKCQEHTQTLKPHTVMFENRSRALTGTCQKCGTEVYRILGPRDQAAAQAAAPVAQATVRSSQVHANVVQAGDRRIPVSRGADAKNPSRWTYVAAAGLIVGIIVAFFAYSLY